MMEGGSKREEQKEEVNNGDRNQKSIKFNTIDRQAPEMVF